MSEEKTVALIFVCAVCVPVCRPASLGALFITENRFVLYIWRVSANACQRLTLRENCCCWLTAQSE